MKPRTTIAPQHQIGKIKAETIATIKENEKMKRRVEEHDVRYKRMKDEMNEYKEKTR